MELYSISNHNLIKQLSLVVAFKDAEIQELKEIQNIF